MRKGHEMKKKALFHQLTVAGKICELETNLLKCPKSGLVRPGMTRQFRPGTPDSPDSPSSRTRLSQHNPP